MIIIADAHVSSHSGNDIPFFNMLAAFENNHHDIIFLGDIFELWFALPGYEEKIHKDFLAWCKEQKKYRTIGFIEGNHEFFLARQNKDFFSWCSEQNWHKDENNYIFCHGDTINQKDRGYLLFKKMIKNPVVRFILMRLTFGPELTFKIRKILKKRNAKIKKYLPEKEINAFGKLMFTKQAKAVFAGHFHQKYFFAKGRQNFYIIPDWLSTEKVGIYDRRSNNINLCHWSEIKQNRENT